MSTLFQSLQALADTPGADLADAALELARLFQPDLVSRPWLGARRLSTRIAVRKMIRMPKPYAAPPIP